MMLRLLSRGASSSSVRAFATRGIATVGVVGGGQMGTGIAFVTAVRAKRNVVVMDVSEEQRGKSITFCEALLAKEVKKGKLLQEEADAARARFRVVSTLAELKDVDFLVEAATENVELKQRIFADLDGIMRPDVILATNTSSISITKIAAATKRADKVIGMHFFSPVPVMKIVEVISGLETSQATLDATVALAESMDKVVTKSKNVPGFIANRILMPYINEAFSVLESGIATREDIDTTMKLGTAVATHPSPQPLSPLIIPTPTQSFPKMPPPSTLILLLGADGPAHACGLHWPRHLPQHHAGARGWLRQQVQAVASSTTVRRRRPAGPEGWTRRLRLLVVGVAGVAAI
jgi:3-hydroxybutyryl-CoA dehydrogenase